MTEMPPKKRGGDTRLAAERNGKKVGPPAKDRQRFARRVLVPLHEGDDDSLAHWAEMEGVTKQDLIRQAISRFLIDRQIV